MTSAVESILVSAPAFSDEFAVIRERYLLVTPISTYVDDSGGIWLERSWHYDLVAHLEYLKELTLCAPRQRMGSEPDLVPLELPRGVHLGFVHLPPQTSFLRALLGFPRTFAAIWRAIGNAEIVHAHVHGWPYPSAGSQSSRAPQEAPPGRGRERLELRFQGRAVSGGDSRG
jgi:hypothetical protein